MMSAESLPLGRSGVIPGVGGVEVLRLPDLLRRLRRERPGQEGTQTREVPIATEAMQYGSPLYPQLPPEGYGQYMPPIPVPIEPQNREPNPKHGAYGFLLGDPRVKADEVVRYPGRFFNRKRVRHAIKTGLQRITLSEREILVRKYGNQALQQGAIQGGKLVGRAILDVATPAGGSLLAGAVPFVRLFVTAYSAFESGSIEQIAPDVLLTITDSALGLFTLLTGGILVCLTFPAAVVFDASVAVAERRHSEAVDQYVLPRMLYALATPTQNAAHHVQKLTLAKHVLAMERQNPNLFQAMYQELQDLNPNIRTPNNENVRLTALRYMAQIDQLQREIGQLQAGNPSKTNRTIRQKQQALSAAHAGLYRDIIGPYEEAWQMYMIWQLSTQIANSQYNR